VRPCHPGRVSGAGPRLVGREKEVILATEALRSAAAGRPRTVIISGEAGIGKSRLVEEMMATAQHDGFLVAAGFCSQVGGTRLPYAPILDLVDGVRRQAEEMSLVVPRVTAQAVELLSGTGPALTGTDPTVATTRLFGALVSAVTELSEQCPVQLVVEDAHWIDPASMDLLSFAARRFRQNRIALVITSRQSGQQSRTPDRAALAELRRLPTTLDLQLTPIDRSAVRELIDALPHPPGAHRRDQIAELAQGVPFFAVHLTLYDDEAAVPPLLRDVLLSSIEDLPPDQRSLLVVLALFGDLVDHDLLLAAVGGQPEELIARARTLTERGLIVAQDGTLGFRHALLREVVLDDTLPSERVVAHARIAEALLASPMADQPVRAAQLAHHLLESGRHREALRYAMRAARYAGKVWAVQDAHNLYSAVLRLWDLVDDASEVAGTTRMRVLCDAATTSRWCGRFDEALRQLDQCAKLPAISPHEIAQIERRRGQVHWSAGDMGASLEAYRRALAAMPEHSATDARAAVLADLAQGLMATGHASDAEATARQAADLAEQVGDERVRLHALITRAVARAQLGDVDAALAGLRECGPQARSLDDVELVLRWYGNLTFALGVACRYEELAAAAAGGMEVCRRYGPVVSLASTLISNEANALVTLGRWDEAVALAREALADVTAGGVADHLRALLAEVAVARGEVEEAEEQLALLRRHGSQNPYVAYALALTEAELHLWNHSPDAAAATLARALPDLVSQDDQLPILEACRLALRAEVELAEAALPRRRSAPTDRRDELLEIARVASRRTMLPVAAAVMLAIEAEAERVVGADRPAQWMDAARANAELGRTYAHAYCLTRAGEALLRGQARSGATEVLRQAHAFAVDLGARPLLAEIQTLVRLGSLSLEPDPPPAPRRPGAAESMGLTPRERQTLALLTTGATNRRIARTLFISERTASVHVSNILAKLGAANRTEAARIALQLSLDTDEPTGG
jgi:DNA-binding CsgD family transcriptional regulator